MKKQKSLRLFRKEIYDILEATILGLNLTYESDFCITDYRNSWEIRKNKGDYHTFRCILEINDKGDIYLEYKNLFTFDHLFGFDVYSCESLFEFVVDDKGDYFKICLNEPKDVAKVLNALVKEAKIR